jgi:antitoxin (DNA-binding transcriptional repressor) of toxin-antitoxin stability system
MDTKTIDLSHASIEELVKLLREGQEFVLTDADEPLARVLPIHGKRIPGLNRGAMSTSPDFDAPLDETILLGE